MDDTTAAQNGSATHAEGSRRQSIWDAPPLSPEEEARRERDAQRCKEAYSANPFYAERAAKDPDYWRSFLTGGVNEFSRPE
ncbi:hypothetical protein GVO57_13995 (plasmid) [Sphingomonas changnyeongensis]|uniref:Uncharacterized protein n=1 Tax=Sphingomonas changnyeongensis TaxID=2698679 RepID=A0A7Z2NZ13_9SPHN|nr:hypothetical protein [Sphingomonas changnyeongensis]QHL92005.1 hypothetical protein GVO57_13995 [Sphingomonas changnyeongensis]